MEQPIVAPILVIIMCGVGGAVVLTMLFNRQSRQGFHDMLTHTYVIYLRGTPVEALPLPQRRQWIPVGVAMFLTVVGTIVATVFSPPKTELEHVLEMDGRFFSVSVSSLTTYADRKTTRSLEIDGWVKGELTDDERTAVINDIARRALTMRDIAGYDQMKIDVDSAYDFGFASGHRNRWDSETIVAWRDRVGR
jgi:hypothetical protein